MAYFPCLIERNHLEHLLKMQPKPQPKPPESESPGQRVQRFFFVSSCMDLFMFNNCPHVIFMIWQVWETLDHRILLV